MLTILKLQMNNYHIIDKGIYFFLHANRLFSSHSSITSSYLCWCVCLCVCVYQILFTSPLLFFPVPPHILLIL